MNIITVEELEALFRLIVLKLKHDSLTSFKFDADEYWQVLSSDMTNFSDSPQPAVGSLVEDIASLKNTVEEGEIHTYSDFDRVSAVLKFISEMQAPS